MSASKVADGSRASTLASLTGWSASASTGGAIAGRRTSIEEAGIETVASTKRFDEASRMPENRPQEDALQHFILGADAAREAGTRRNRRRLLAR
jgi:hypothetical protein